MGGVVLFAEKMTSMRSRGIATKGKSNYKTATALTAAQEWTATRENMTPRNTPLSLTMWRLIHTGTVMKMAKYPTWSEIVDRMATKYGITVNSTERFGAIEIASYVEAVTEELTEGCDIDG